MSIYVGTAQLSHFLIATRNSMMKQVTQFTTHFSSSSDLLCCSALARAMVPVAVRSLCWRLQSGMNTSQSMAMAMTLLTTIGAMICMNFNWKCTSSWGHNSSFELHSHSQRKHLNMVVMVSWILGNGMLTTKIWHLMASKCPGGVIYTTLLCRCMYHVKHKGMKICPFSK